MCQWAWLSAEQGCEMPVLGGRYSALGSTATCPSLDVCPASGSQCSQISCNQYHAMASVSETEMSLFCRIPELWLGFMMSFKVNTYFSIGKGRLIYFGTFYFAWNNMERSQEQRHNGSQLGVSPLPAWQCKAGVRGEAGREAAWPLSGAEGYLLKSLHAARANTDRILHLWNPIASHFIDTQLT